MNEKRQTCEQHMCDGSGWRQAGGWHLLSPCYCEKGRAEKAEHARTMRLRLEAEHASYQLLADLDAAELVAAR